MRLSKGGLLLLSAVMLAFSIYIFIQQKNSEVPWKRIGSWIGLIILAILFLGAARIFTRKRTR